MCASRTQYKVTDDPPAQQLDKSIYSSSHKSLKNKPVRKRH